MSLTARLRSAIPPAIPTLAGALCWAIAMAAGAGLAILLRGWYRPPVVMELLVIFFLGGLVAWPLARFASRLAAPVPEGTRRIAADILATSAATVAITAFVFAQQFREQYAHWHGETLSVFWAFNFVFTTANAMYQFSVLGLRLFLPAFIILLPAYLSWRLARRR